MMEKIIQIIPCNTGYEAVYANDDRKGFITSPILCLGLVEVEELSGEKWRYIKAFDASSDGDIDAIQESANFVMLILPGNTVAPIDIVKFWERKDLRDKIKAERAARKHETNKPT